MRKSVASEKYGDSRMSHVCVAVGENMMHSVSLMYILRYERSIFDGEKGGKVWQFELGHQRFTIQNSHVRSSVVGKAS